MLFSRFSLNLAGCDGLLEGEAEPEMYPAFQRGPSEHEEQHGWQDDPVGGTRDTGRRTGYFTHSLLLYSYPNTSEAQVCIPGHIFHIQNTVVSY